MFQSIDNQFLLYEPVVLAVGCDEAACQILKTSLRRLDVAFECHASIEQLAKACEPDRRGCVFLDLERLALAPQDALRRMAEHGIHLPVVLLAPQSEGEDGDLPEATRAVRQGAFDYLPRPWLPRRLVAIAGEALQWESAHRAEVCYRVLAVRRLGRLDDDERELLGLIVDGASNKAISSLLGLSTRTVEQRRRDIKEKMKSKNLADLVRQAVTAGVGRQSE